MNCAKTSWMTSPNEIRRRREDIVTRGTEAFDESEFGQSAGGAATAEHCDEIDGLCDERARDGNDRFLHELLETPQGADGRASMNGADPAGMAGSPGFQQVQRFGATHLADWYAIRPQPERRTHEIGEGSNAIPGAQRHEVRRLALKLAGVLDQHHAIGRLRHFGKERIDQGRPLAGPQPPLPPGNLITTLMVVGNDLLPGVGFTTNVPVERIDLAVAFGDAAIPIAARRVI